MQLQNSASMIYAVKDSFITLPPVVVQSIAITVSVCLLSSCLFVCLSVCLLAYLKNHTSKFRQIFCMCYPWPWLGPVISDCILMIDCLLDWQVITGYTWNTTTSTCRTHLRSYTSHRRARTLRWSPCTDCGTADSMYVQSLSSTRLAFAEGRADRFTLIHSCSERSLTQKSVKARGFPQKMFKTSKALKIQYYSKAYIDIV